MERQISFIKPFIILFGILSMSFSWIITGISFSYLSNSLDFYIEWNLVGVIVVNNISDEFTGLYDQTMRLGGILYCCGVIVGFFTYKSKSFPLISLASVLLSILGVFVYIAGAQAFLADLYNAIDPYYRVLLNARSFVQIQLGMILAFVSIALLGIEMILFIINFDMAFYPKRKEGEILAEQKGIVEKKPVYSPEILSQPSTPQSATTRINYCPFCGYFFKDPNVKFCGNCGNRLPL